MPVLPVLTIVFILSAFRSSSGDKNSLNLILMEADSKESKFSVAVKPDENYRTSIEIAITTNSRNA